MNKEDDYNLYDIYFKYFWFFTFLFSRYKEAFPLNEWNYKNLVNYTSISRINTFKIFSLPDPSRTCKLVCIASEYSYFYNMFIYTNQ